MIETYVIHVTKQCNCDCLYCYEKDKTSTYDWEEVKFLLDNIKENNKGKYNIEFLGGEPCLRSDLIENTMYYMDPDTAVITTNGTVVDEKIINLLRTYPNLFWAASIDGHNFANSLRITKEGKNTHDMVMNNFMKLSACGVPNEQLGAHIVTHHYNVGFLFDSVKHLHNVGFRNIGIGNVESTMRIDDEYCYTYQEQMKKISRAIHAGLLPDIKIDEFNQKKPKEDQRTYIYDDDGKLIGETYGRADNDIISQDIKGINPNPVSSDLGERILQLRHDAHDYHANYRRYFGCGTGRCGSKSLAKIIASNTNLKTAHEFMEIPWEYDEKIYNKLVEFDGNIVGMGLIHYARKLLEETTCSFICIKRDKPNFIKSFLNAHSLNEDSTWIEIANHTHYPAFDDSANVIDCLSYFYDIYYETARNLSDELLHFNIADFESLKKQEIPEINRDVYGFFVP